MGSVVDALPGHRRIQYISSLASEHRQWGITRLTFHPAFALGIGMRFGLHSHPDSKGIYIAEYLFVVLSVRNFPATPRKSIHSVRSAVCFHCCGLHLARAASEVPAL